MSLVYLLKIICGEVKKISEVVGVKYFDFDDLSEVLAFDYG